MPCHSSSHLFYLRKNAVSLVGLRLFVRFLFIFRFLSNIHYSLFTLHTYLLCSHRGTLNQHHRMRQSSTLPSLSPQRPGAVQTVDVLALTGPCNHLKKKKSANELQPMYCSVQWVGRSVLSWSLLIIAYTCLIPPSSASPP